MLAAGEPALQQGALQPEDCGQAGGPGDLCAQVQRVGGPEEKGDTAQQRHEQGHGERLRGARGDRVDALRQLGCGVDDLGAAVDRAFATHADFRPIQAEGIAETDIEAVAIPRAVFDDLTGRSTTFRTFVFRAYSRRIADLFALIDDIGNYDAPVMLIFFYLMLSS